MSRMSGIPRRREPIRLGFLPASDCAPLVYAHEAGLFEKYELDVELLRETSWSNVRDKVVQGDLDAAQAPATLPFLANIGLESDPCACVSGLVLSLQGNAIALSTRLWDEGVRDAVTLRERIYKRWGKRTYTFGVAFPFSPQEMLLRHWLQSAGVLPEVEVRIVGIPPTQLFPTLKLGYIDGFCAGEPWASLATQAGVAKCVATSRELAPLHPEKVLMVRQSFAIGRADEHERLLAALIEACAFCDQPQNRLVFSDMLAHPHYVNAPAEALRAGLAGPFEWATHQAQDFFDLTIFHRHNANDPSDEKARWLMERLHGLLETSFFKRQNFGRTPVLKNVFRRDIYERAVAALQSQATQVAREARRYNPASL